MPIHSKRQKTRLDPILLFATACAVAPQVAQNIANKIQGEALSKVMPYYICHCISLGRKDAVIQKVGHDDSMQVTVVGGDIAVKTKEQISQEAWWPDFETILAN